jgi:alpha-L-arabinofuranosidase
MINAAMPNSSIGLTSIPKVNCSASIKDGIPHITLVNASVGEAQNISFNLHGGIFAGKGSIVTLSSDSHKDGNSYEAPYKVMPKVKPTTDTKVEVTIPAASVALLTLPFYNDI